MKKILQINVVANKGSTGRITEEIGLLLKQAGWNSYIAYGRDFQPSHSKLIRIGNDWDIKNHAIQTRLFDNHGFASKKATQQLIAQIEEIKPDIINLHNIHGYYLHVGLLFNCLKISNIPVVWTLHDCWAFTGHCAYYDYIGCEKWKSECFKCPQKSSYPSSLLFDRSLKNYTDKKAHFTSLHNVTIVTPSAWLAKQVKQSFLSSYPVHIINNGIDLSTFHPQSSEECHSLRKSLNLEGKIILLGVASTWDGRKGLEDFITMNEILNDNFRIVLVGLTKKQIHKLPKNIVGIERTESVQQLATLYSLADIFINPSVEETFGLVTAEAMACGTPCIVYNATASPELIDSNCGIVIKKKNIQQLLDAIQEITGKGKSFYSSACVNRAQSLYNKNERYKDYLDLYNKILSANNISNVQK
jgi:putative colanic acid biosynthesis glycosyltransferase